METLYHQLRSHACALQARSIYDLFTEDTTRFDNFHLQHDGILLDYSKNLIDAKTLTLLHDFLQSQEFNAKRTALFSGEHVNTTENLPALHMALRHFGKKFPPDILQLIADTRKQMIALTAAIESGDSDIYKIPTPITDLVNIGVGGSDLGPAMAMQALTPFVRKTIKCHFVSNLDGGHLHDICQQLNPHQTLFLISSKSFTTYETLKNAESARNWLENIIGNSNISQHFFAITANAPEAEKFGIAPQNIFPLWDFVGGRTSLCSAIGLSLMIGIGSDNFMALLHGFASIDDHFYNAPLAENLPINLALMHIWNRNFLGTTSHAIIPYDYRMQRFPAYLQQLLMESGGKSTALNGENVFLKTSPIYWGEPGSNAQHSFFQLLHQGSDLIPIDFLLARQAIHSIDQHHAALAASCFAQAESLMIGKQTNRNSNAPAPSSWQKFTGNRPSNMILYPSLTPYYLGALIALYEHCCFTQSVFWNINPFDQFGVEFGKQEMKKLSALLHDETQIDPHWDSSTLGLIYNFHHGVKSETKE